MRAISVGGGGVLGRSGGTVPRECCGGWVGRHQAAICLTDLLLMGLVADVLVRGGGLSGTDPSVAVL